MTRGAGTAMTELGGPSLNFFCPFIFSLAPFLFLLVCVLDSTRGSKR